MEIILSHDGDYKHDRQEAECLRRKIIKKIKNKI